MRTRMFQYLGRKGGAVVCCLVLAAVLHRASPVSAITQGDSTMSFQLSSTAFKQGAYIPKNHSGEGADRSPALQWANPPAGVKSFALICDDPDAPMGTWVHWVLFNIPASATGLPEGVPADKELKDGARQGMNDFKKIGYGGPMPPRGSDHRYFFKLYALDCTLTLSAGVKKADVLKAMETHILGQTELMGRYKR